MIHRLLLVLILLLAAPATAADKKIAFTFDDAPRIPGPWLTPAERTVALIAALHRAGVKQAAFFVNPGNLAQPWGKGGEDRLTDYVAAGHVLGNHSWSHPHLTGVADADYLADVDRATDWLKDREGFRPWYRFPFLDEGKDAAQRDAIRAAFAKRGLRTAYVTVDPSDWFIEQLLIDAGHRGKTIDMAALRDLFVQEFVGVADNSDRVARLLGQRPVQVVLMHETDLEATFVEPVAKALRADGWEIVPIDQAFAHPLPAPTGTWIGGNQLNALAGQAGHLAPELVYQPAQTSNLEQAFNERVLHKPAKTQ